MQRDLAPGQSLRDVILERTQRFENTGLENPLFDPFSERDFRIATQRMVGDDPDYQEFLGLLDATRPVPQAPPPEPTTREGPGLFERFFGGGAQTAPAPNPATPPAAAPPSLGPVNPETPFPQRRTTQLPTAPVTAQPAPAVPQTIIPGRRTTAFPAGVSSGRKSALPASLKARLDRGDVLAEAPSFGQFTIPSLKSGGR